MFKDLRLSGSVPWWCQWNTCTEESTTRGYIREHVSDHLINETEIKFDQAGTDLLLTCSWSYCMYATETSTQMVEHISQHMESIHLERRGIYLLRSKDQDTCKNNIDPLLIMSRTRYGNHKCYRQMYQEFYTHVNIHSSNKENAGCPKTNEVENQCQWKNCNMGKDSNIQHPMQIIQILQLWAQRSPRKTFK